MKQCFFRKITSIKIDYKDTGDLKKFQTLSARIVSKKSCVTAKNQKRKLALAVKRARFMALLPYVARDEIVEGL